MYSETSIQIELLDFLAEKFLQQGSTISYTSLDGIPALQISSYEEEQLFLSNYFSGADLSSLPKELKILVPVISRKEESRLLKILSDSGRGNIRPYHLSLLDRYSFLNRQFCKKQLAV